MTDDMLNGWGEIAAYLRVSVVTAWRYERDGGMPIIMAIWKSADAVGDAEREWQAKRLQEILYS